jgi:predicted phosphodiesterase
VAQIIVLSDIHGNLRALEAVWHDIERRPGARVFCLGDLAAFGPEPEACIRFVRDVVRPEAVIRGNTDRYLVEQPWSSVEHPTELQQSLAWTRGRLSADSVGWLGTLAAEHHVSVDGYDLHLTHGAPGVTFCGHTHVPFRKRIGPRLVINDGSVGLPFDGDQRAGYSRATITASGVLDYEFRRVSYPTDIVIAELRTAAPPWVDTLVRRLRFAERV